jgi:hypothetical protein
MRRAKIPGPIPDRNTCRTALVLIRAIYAFALGYDRDLARAGEIRLSRSHDLCKANVPSSRPRGRETWMNGVKYADPVDTSGCVDFGGRVMVNLFGRAWVPVLASVAALAGVLAAVPEARAGDAAGPVAVPQTMQQLVRMPEADLRALFAASPAATEPSGFVPGRAIKSPGTRMTVPNSRATRLVWQGKIFSNGKMVNRVFGVGKAIPADVYLGESLTDGQPALIFDYSHSKLWPDVRDEVREVSPGLYLGIMYKGKSPPKEKMFFTLDARK